MKGAILFVILSIAMMATTTTAQHHHHPRIPHPKPHPIPHPKAHPIPHPRPHPIPHLPHFRPIPFIPVLPKPYVQPPQPSPSPSLSPDAAPTTPVVSSPTAAMGDAQSQCYVALHDNHITSCIQDIINNRFNPHFSVSSQCCSLLTTCQAVVRRTPFMDQFVSTYCH